MNQEPLICEACGKPLAPSRASRYRLLGEESKKFPVTCNITCTRQATSAACKKSIYDKERS